MKLVHIGVEDVGNVRRISLTVETHKSDVELSANQILSVCQALEGGLGNDGAATRTKKDETTASTASRSRRGRGKAKETETDEPSGSNEPSSGRRSRRGAKQQEPAEAGEGTAKSSRRRRGGESAAASSESKVGSTRRSRRTTKEDKGISDADLAKAASEAAAVIGPDVVTQILDEDHGVETVNELPQDQRKKFTATLLKEIKLEKDDA